MVELIHRRKTCEKYEDAIGTVGAEKKQVVGAWKKEFGR